MRTSRFGRAAAFTALAVGGVTLVAIAPATAATCSSGVPGDVNGDGFAEVAVSEAGRSFGKGAVHVFYGRAKGLAAKASGKALDDQYLDQEQSGVPGSGADYDDFGTTVAFGDFDGDGCADLAVGAATDSTAGTIYVFRGSPKGLRTSGSVRITNEQVFGPPGQPRDQGFGSSMEAGDLNGDGITDLAVSAPLKLVPGDGLGAVAVLLGGADGLTGSRKTVLDRTSATIAPDAGPIGSELAIGDFDGDDAQELALDVGNGQVQVVEGTATGFAPTTTDPISGPSLGFDDLVVGDDGEPDQRVFGDVLAAGDADGDGDDDLAVGMPALERSEGAVVLVKGSAGGLTADGLEGWTQATTGVAGTPHEDESFGAALAFGRLDSGATDDLAIGIPYDLIGDRRGAGSAVVLLGSAGGLTTAGVGGTRYHQDTAGVPGTAENGDTFGRALTIAHVQNGTRGSLVIGAPREKIGSVSATGQFHQLAASTTGPKASGSVAFNLDSSGVRGASRKEAELGRALD